MDGLLWGQMDVGAVTHEEAPRILVVDDEKVIRDILTECLTMDHFRLTPPESRESVDLAIVAD